MATLLQRSNNDRENWALRRIALEKELRKPTLKRKLWKSLFGIFSIFLKITGLEKRGIANALNIQITPHVIRDETLPKEFEGFKILQISDPHFDAIEELSDQINTAVKSVGEVDICVLTGDYINRSEVSHKRILPCLKSLKDQVHAKYGVWAILGNHDCCDMVTDLEEMGIKCLINEHLDIVVDDKKLRFTGLDDVYMFRTEQADDCLSSGDADYSIALIHSPEFVEETEAAGYRLYLTGHTHGGQICTVNGKAILKPVNKGHAYVQGLWKYKKMNGITSNGAGVSNLPVRYFSHSEINVIEVRSSA